MTAAPSDASPLERFAVLSPGDQARLVEEGARKHGLSPNRMRALLLRSWSFVGRPKQQPPPGDWLFWFLMAGRGFGKTLSGAQWAKAKGLERRVRFAVVAPTLGDVRATCFEGETGLLNVLPTEKLLGQSIDHAWNKSLLELTLANGTIYKGFSAEEPDRLRGPQHHYAWGEEVSSWKDAKAGDALNTTFSNLKLGLRLGDRPQAVLTSTPKVNKLTRELVELGKAGRLVLARGSSFENRANLSEAWWEDVIAPLEGTRTGRQEIEAELLEDVEGALWAKGQLDELRLAAYPPLSRIVVGVDPNTTSGESADAAGIVVAGMGFSDKHVYVLEDRTQTRGGPAAWAQAAVDAYHDWRADKVVVEVNNGGEMCKLVIAGVDPSVPVKMVTASRGKRTRAEPVAAIYEGLRSEETGGWVREPRAHHVGTATEFADLEDEMTTWTPEQESPNRMDALVWAITELRPWKPPSSARGAHRPRGVIPGVQTR